MFPGHVRSPLRRFSCRARNELRFEGCRSDVGLTVPEIWPFSWKLIFLAESPNFGSDSRLPTSCARFAPPMTPPGSDSRSSASSICLATQMNASGTDSRLPTFVCMFGAANDPIRVRMEVAHQVPPHLGTAPACDLTSEGPHFSDLSSSHPSSIGV